MTKTALVWVLTGICGGGASPRCQDPGDARLANASTTSHIIGISQEKGHHMLLPYHFPAFDKNMISQSRCSDPKPAPPAVYFRLPPSTPSRSAANSSRSEKALVRLNFPCPHGRGQDRQGLLMHLHTES